MIIIINLYQPRAYYIGIYFIHITYHLIYTHYYILLYLYLYSLYIYRVFRAFPSALPRRARGRIFPTIIYLCNALYTHIIIYYYSQCIYLAIPYNYTCCIILPAVSILSVYSLSIYLHYLNLLYILSLYIITLYYL